MLEKINKIKSLDKIFDMKKKYMKMKFEIKLGNIKNTGKIRRIRKNIAKIMTKINKKS